MEFVDGHYLFSVANKSMFMQEYLSTEEYCKFYGEPSHVRRESYASIDEIEDTCKRGQYLNVVLNNRKVAFKNMKQKVDETLRAVKSGEIHIIDVDYFDDPYYMIDIYGARDLFECTVNDDDEVVGVKEPVRVRDDTGEEVELFCEDLKQGFGLGLPELKDIARIKRIYGQVENVLL